MLTDCSAGCWPPTAGGGRRWRSRLPRSLPYLAPCSPVCLRSCFPSCWAALQPFLYADIVTTTTHKSLRGPRAGMIFFRRVGLA